LVDWRKVIAPHLTLGDCDCDDDDDKHYLGPISLSTLSRTNKNKEMKKEN